MTISTGTQFDFFSTGSLGIDSEYITEEFDMVLVNDFAAVNHTVDNALYTVAGTVAAGGGTGILLEGDNSELRVTASGTVASATTQAIRALAVNLEIYNAGIMTGKQYGIISTNTGLSLENDGYISGGTYGIFFETGASGFNIVNDTTGVIRGGSTAINCTNDSSGSLTNFGTIEGTGFFAGGVSLRGTTFDVSNSGAIIGSGALTIIFDGTSTITNEEDGLILGRTRAIQTNSLTDSSDMTIVNHGIIESQQFVGVSMFSGGDLINTGTILGFGGNKAVQGGGDDGGRFTLLNTGQLFGGVEASNYNDDVDTFNGTYTGSIEMGGGRDVFTGSNLQDDNAFGEAGNDEMYGYSGNDFLSGGRNNDTLFGGRGADTLDGGADNDTLNGGGGNDSLTGGAGLDTFVFSLGSGDDTIEDWNSADDTIDLTAFGIQLFQLNNIWSVDGTTVTFDLDLIGGTGDIIVLNGAFNLFADDFLV